MSTTIETPTKTRRYETAWDLADAHVTDLLAVLKTMGQRGIRVDREKLDEFNQSLDEEMAALQQRFDSDPELMSVRGWHPKEGYVREPKDLTGLEQIDVLVKWKPSKKEATVAEDKTVRRWARRKPFLATSSQQVLAYIKSKGHRVELKKDRDTGEQKETSGQKALLLAWRKYKDDHYRQFVDYRKLKKLRGTYGEWPLQRRGDDLYVITRFTLRPDNGRLSSLNPNIQNIPRDGPLAKLFKSCLVASPGCVLVRGDWTSAEALVTGYLAGDEVYMRLCRGGIHKFTLAQHLKIPVHEGMSNEEIDRWTVGLKEQHHELYRKVKTARFGSTYLAGPLKIFKENPEDFESAAEAKKFQQLCKRPKITAWQTRTINQATASKRLVNPFGYEKQFWDLPGGDGPSAVAFLPSSIIAYIAKEIMLQLWPLETGKYLVWQIHDELVADVPINRAEAVRDEMKVAMEQPWPELGGLSIGAEMKISESMA